MPHIEIDYSANIADAIETSELPRKLHQAAHKLGVFPTNGVRTFARKVDIYHAGSDRGEEAFIQIRIRVAPGRPEELMKRIAETFFQTACDAMSSNFDTRELGLQLEVSEFTDELTYRRNTINNQ